MVKLHRMLVATDFSDSSKEALDYAVSLAKSLAADIYLLQVFEPPFYPPRGAPLDAPQEVHRWIRGLKEGELRKLNELAEDVRRHGVRVHPIQAEGAPFEEILKAAEGVHSDLIVMGTHGRGGWDRFLMGSVAEKVARHASCPVLTVKPKALVQTARKEG